MEPVDSPFHLMIGDDLASWRRASTNQKKEDTLIIEWTDGEVFPRDLPWFIWGNGDRTMTREQMHLVTSKMGFIRGVLYPLLLVARAEYMIC